MKEEILNDYMNSLSGPEIKRKYNISYYKIYKYLNSEGITKKFSNWEIYKPRILNLYNKGLSKITISKELNIYVDVIDKFLKDEGILIRKTSEINRKNFFNENYFEKIDTFDKAYFLGLLYADGNVYLKRNRVQINLATEDSYILSLFSKYINSTAKLYKDNNNYKLILDSKIITNDLIKLGCIPSKSLILKFPTEQQVPKEYMSHFIRGYFDGDGCISITKTKQVNITGSFDFINGLKEYLTKNENIKFGVFNKRYKDNINSAGTINLSRFSHTDFFNYIYKNKNDLFLSRKYNKYEHR